MKYLKKEGQYQTLIQYPTRELQNIHSFHQYQVFLIIHKSFKKFELYLLSCQITKEQNFKSTKEKLQLCNALRLNLAKHL